MPVFSIYKGSLYNYLYNPFLKKNYFFLYSQFLGTSTVFLYPFKNNNKKGSVELISYASTKSGRLDNAFNYET